MLPIRLIGVVEGLIQRGANGLMIARPKSGKSFAVLDLAVAIASGQRWLDFYVPKRARVALVSREDYFGLTQARERKIRKHRQLMAERVGWVVVHQRQGYSPQTNAGR
jgi:RecA-family ATPase